MKSKLHRIWIFFVFSVISGAATAQDIRVYTRIYRDEVPVGKSLMLIHAGKIYDYIEPAQEVTVFEPALQRFTVLSKTHELRSELSQEEIRHFLSLASAEAQKELTANLDESDPIKRRMFDFLQFQLQPSFTTTYDDKRSELSLESDAFHYTVSAFAPTPPDVAEKYLHVADWVAQLNSVLHPRSFLPGPRLRLNQELRQRGLIPKTVELTADTEPSIHLIAHHQWTWNLKETDRQMIDEWEALLRAPNIRSLPFRKFQQELLKLEALKKR